ncbi:MAG: hypothetical protein ACFE0S_09015 [Rhodospirillales bacterium]
MLFPNLIGTFYLWIMRRRQRRRLRLMEPWQLDYLGLSGRDAEMESRKPCWRA